MGEHQVFRVSAEAAAVAAATERWPQWLHRRYETISFESIDSIRHSARLEFSIPEELASLSEMRWIRVPLIKVPKAEIATTEVIDETGARVMVLTSVENRKLTAEMFVAQLRASTTAEGYEDLCTEEAIASLLGLVSEDDYVAAARQSLRFHEHVGAVIGDLFPLDSRTATIAYRASEFVANELVFVALPLDSETRRVLTLEHHEAISRLFRPGLRTEVGRRGFVERIGELLGWRDTVESFEVQDGGISETLEIAARVPDGVGLRNMAVHTLFREFAEVGSARSTQLQAPQVLHTRVSSVAEDEPASVLACLRAAPSYSAAVAGASLFSAIVLTAGTFGLDHLNQVTDAAVTLLLAGPTLFASLIALPGRGRLAAETVRGARTLLGATAVATFIAALSLVAISPGEVQSTTWVVLTSITWAITALLVFGVLLRFRQIRGLKEDGYDLEREEWERSRGL
jgi:hypothetical protein